MAERLNIVLCEDDRNDRNQLIELLNSCSILCDITSFCDAESLLEYSRLDTVDLFLLDIYMNNMSGLKLAEELRNRNIKGEIVFITSSPDHALEGFKVNALQYLVKPVDQKSLANMLERFIKINDRIDLNYCRVSVNKEERDIYYRDIQYIEIIDKYCKIHTNDGIIETYSTLSKLLKKLPSPPFLRCHRSFVVNMDQVENIVDDFIMKNGEIVYIHQYKKEEVKNEYMKYLINNFRGESSEENS